MAINKTAVPDARLNMKIRSLFLDHLAQTANVSASALAAGVKSSAVYAERRRTPAFRDAWALALAEGYARLETELLAEALQSASGRTADGTLKARAQKHRLAIALLNAHRASVKGGAPVAAAKPAVPDLATLKAQLVLKLTHMRQRAEDNAAARPEPETEPEIEGAPHADA
ncbi:hypothetical protein [Sphingorhabdus wooponensis]|uniref:Terminase n=1 Tax=Sphingorhabdus wooponensis TaxID=940136 RepID=A0A3R8Q2C2_9SPHN|nr:hypothetical protein [Sphingorhabdus wooponensis]RRQ51660.1 hypothetical protein D7D48_01820 [Sphingorhabdus wooponensis]